MTPIVIPSDVDESLPPEMEGSAIEDVVMYLAHLKARAVYESLRGGEFAAPFILAADTVVYKDEMIGKPVDEADAFRILDSLRGSEHRVISGVSFIETADGAETQFFDTTRVHFKHYSDEEIYRYIRAESPYDKSGSYAIQSSWSKNVERVEGDVENVMGLPWYRVEALIASRNI
jgi:septum formation protein